MSRWAINCGKGKVQKGIVQRIIMEKYWNIVIKTKHYESVENICTHRHTHTHIHIHTDTHTHKCVSECAYACIHTSIPHNI